MFIHLQHTELVAASPEQLFAVLTDYKNYPRWNGNVVSATIVRRGEHEADVRAVRTTLLGRKVHFINRYAPKPPHQFELPSISINDTARPPWTVDPDHT